MDRFQSTIDIDAPVDTCYQQWRNFEAFPGYMKNVRSVRFEGANKDGSQQKWHWVVRGPFGQDIEWDAVIDGDEPNRLVSWHSISHAGEHAAGVQGAVLFDAVAPNRTRLTCTVQYAPPAGGLGTLIANMTTHPQHLLEEDLQNFKHAVEGTNVPAQHYAGKNVGKVRGVSGVDAPADEPVSGHYRSAGQNVDVADSDSGANTVSNQASRNAGLPSRGSNVEYGIPDRGEVQETTRTAEPGYEGPYGIDEAADYQGGAVMGELLDETLVIEAETLENPYLGEDGAIYSEDIIEVRADKNFPDRNDVFTESMDVYGEDLENFTEDLDEDIDSSVGTPRELSGEFGPGEDVGSNPMRKNEESRRST